MTYNESVDDSAEGAVVNPQSGHGLGDGTSEGVATSQSGGSDGSKDTNWAKRVEDLQKQISRLQSDRDTAFAENKKLQEQFLSRLTDAVTQPKPDNSASERQAYLENLAKQLDENLDGKTLVNLLDQMARDARTGAVSDAEQKIRALEAKLGTLQQTMSEYDPKWLSVKSKVDSLGLREKFPNADREQLIAIANLVQPGVTQPPVPDAPGGIGGGIRAGQSSGATSKSDVTAVSQFLKSCGVNIGELSEAKKAELLKKWSR